jgi:small-conductance mechanosensitive channel
VFAKAIATAIAVSSVFLLLYVTKVSIRRVVRQKSFRESRGWFIYKVSRAFVLLFAILAVISIWGVNVRNIWVFVTSVVGIIAIGFFAVWSLLSNIVAGFFLFVADPFKLDDEIVILPEGLQGTVIDLKLMFVVLRDGNGDILHVPNNLLFQRVVKKIGREGDSAEGE